MSFVAGMVVGAVVGIGATIAVALGWGSTMHSLPGDYEEDDGIYEL